MATEVTELVNHQWFTAWVTDTKRLVGISKYRNWLHCDR